MVCGPGFREWSFCAFPSTGGWPFSHTEWNRWVDGFEHDMQEVSMFGCWLNMSGMLARSISADSFQRSCYQVSPLEYHLHAGARSSAVSEESDCWSWMQMFRGRCFAQWRAALKCSRTHHPRLCCRCESGMNFFDVGILGTCGFPQAN